MDSAALASYLEGQYPSPSMNFSPLIQEAEKMILRVLKPTQGIWLPLVAHNLLNLSSKEYFERTRSEGLGKSLEAYHKEKGGEDAWIEALPPLKAFGEFLGSKEGPFINGDLGEFKSVSMLSRRSLMIIVSYADFVILSWLQFFKTIDEKLLEKVIGVEPKLGELYDAGKPWLTRVD